MNNGFVDKNDGFIEKLTIIDQWESSSESFRLVNLGAGPDILQILYNGNWREESLCYRWGVLTSRIKSLVAAQNKI